MPLISPPDNNEIHETDSEVLRQKTGVLPSFSMYPYLVAVLSGLRTISERTQQKEREGERALLNVK